MQESHPLHALPAARSTYLIDFETANVITQMIYPPRPVLVVSGKKPDPATKVDLVPLAYMRQPEYWGIEVVGSTTGLARPALTPSTGSIPYSVELNLDGLTGTVGIEVIGANHTEQIPLATVDNTQFVGGVEHSRFRPMFPPWIEDRFLRLTTVSVKDDAGPAAGEIDLTPYDGSIMRVLGQYQDGWIYSATVVERVQDSVLSIVARQVFPDRAL